MRGTCFPNAVSWAEERVKLFDLYTYDEGEGRVPRGREVRELDSLLRLRHKKRKKKTRPSPPPEVQQL